MSASSFFTPDELGRIEQAVRRAESGVSGEIVPVFVARSGPYEQGNLRAGITFAALFILAWLTLYEFGGTWGGHWFYTPGALVTLTVLVFSTAFFAAVSVPRFRCLFITGKELDETVDVAARMAFLKQEVFRTRQRTGMLIFISLLEHRVEVLGDTGISGKVSPGEWDGIVKTIVDGLKNGRSADGICEAVDAARQLLLKNGFTAAPDDTNELPDNLRL